MPLACYRCSVLLTATRQTRSSLSRWGRQKVLHGGFAAPATDARPLPPSTAALELYFLQCRPVVKMHQSVQTVDPKSVFPEDVIVTGRYGLIGATHGVVRVIERFEELLEGVEIQPNEIVVTYKTGNYWNQYLKVPRCPPRCRRELTRAGVARHCHRGRQPQQPPHVGGSRAQHSVHRGRAGRGGGPQAVSGELRAAPFALLSACKYRVAW